MIAARTLLGLWLALACVAAPLVGLDAGGAVEAGGCGGAGGCCCAKPDAAPPDADGAHDTCGGRGDQLVAGCRCGDHPAPASHQHERSEPRLCTAARAALGELLENDEPSAAAPER